MLRGVALRLADHAAAFAARYARIFSIHELAETPTLRWLHGVVLLPFLTSFERYAYSHVGTRVQYEAGLHVCPPHFQDCGVFYVFTPLPMGFSLNAVFMALFAVLAAALYALFRARYVLAHAATLVAFLGKLSYVGLVTTLGRGNYDYYHLTLVAIVLFVPHKLAFARLTFVFLYFLAATVKFHPGWVLGTYFTSMRLGMPIFSDDLAPVLTNVVIVMEMAGSWLLLSRHRLLQRAVLAFFVVFHLYSGLLVGYAYPTACLPPLLVLFGPRPEPFVVPRGRRAIPGLAFLALWLTAQVATELVPGDRKMTLEANEYALYMFEANHQCRSTETTHHRDGRTSVQRRDSSDARNRCDPYRFLFRIRAQCGRNAAQLHRVAWTFDHSINGGPLYRIVDVANACELEYRPFGRNTWIRPPEEGAPIMGYPRKNVYY